jgi:hypothetical protein
MTAQIEKKFTDNLVLLPWLLPLIALFVIPAVMVRVAMVDVPSRSETKVVTVFQNAVNVVEGSFRRHSQQETTASQSRLSPLPTDSVGWIKRINPTGRKAPGGGFAILKTPSNKTGAVGLVGNEHTVTISIPAYRSLSERQVTINAHQTRKGGG